MPIISVLEGSGPVPESGIRMFADDSPSMTAVNVPLTLPETPTQIVGAPALSFTYSGIGTSRTVSIDVNVIRFTTNGDPRELQNVCAATPFVNRAQFLASFDVINVSNLQVSLPTAKDAVPA